MARGVVGDRSTSYRALGRRRLALRASLAGLGAVRRSRRAMPNARVMARGSRAMTCRNARAAPDGWHTPYSHFWRYFTLKLKRFANCACDRSKRLRAALISAGGISHTRKPL